MDKPTTSLGADWVRCESKNRAGRYYMFNQKTGETKWCSSTEPTTPKNIISAKDIVKTPAQDRLKRLQNNLQKPKPNMPNSSRQTKEANTSRVGTKPKITEVKKDSAPKNVEYTNPTTSTQITSPKVKASTSEQTKSNVNKRPLSKPTDGKNSLEPTLKRKFVIPKKPPIKSETSKQGLEKITSANVKKPCDTSASPISTPTNSTAQKMAVKGSPRSKHLEQSKSSQTDVHRSNNSSIFPDSSGTSEATSNSLEKNVEQKSLQSSASQSDVANNNIKEKSLKAVPKPGLMSMVKGFCEKLVNKATKAKKRKPPENKGGEKMLKMSPCSKPPFKPRSTDNGSMIRGVLQENDNSSNQKSPPRLNVSPIVRTVSSPIPVPNISANDRLQRLRNSLHLQQNNIQMPATSFTFSFSSEASNVSSSQDCANVSTSDCEPMDWQPTEDLSASLVPSSSLPVAPAANSYSTSEHYDTVNQNLLRLVADRKLNKWKTDHFYFVVDTNVFINNITFVDELIQMKLCDTMGTIIYVPYCVLQELDKLKIRSPSESVKTRSSRAIKFLNKCFEDKEQHIQAQSAIDEKQHLIKVTSPDDSILNCCLQVKKYVDNMLLLTEDNNLQNKALCSDILVSTKSDLVSKHESCL